MEHNQVKPFQIILKYLKECPVPYEISSFQSNVVHVKIFLPTESSWAGNIKNQRKELTMGKIKQWLMTMEELAEESIQNNFSEEEAVQYMLDNLDIQDSRDTLRDIYRNVKERIDEELS